MQCLAVCCDGRASYRSPLALPRFRPHDPSGSPATSLLESSVNVVQPKGNVTYSVAMQGDVPNDWAVG